MLILSCSINARRMGDRPAVLQLDTSLHNLVTPSPIYPGSGRTTHPLSIPIEPTHVLPCFLHLSLSYTDIPLQACIICFAVAPDRTSSSMISLRLSALLTDAKAAGVSHVVTVGSMVSGPAQRCL